jgi:hypothetical protein
MLRILGIVVIAVALMAGTVSWRERSRVSRMDDSMAARRELSATRLAPAGAAPQAGISARAPIRVPPMPDRLARQLHSNADFHRLSHRCGVCHSTPDPKLHDAAAWSGVVGRMAATIDAAGLLPLSDADRDALLRVLVEHANAPR